MVKPNFVDPDPCERASAGEYAVYVGRLAEDKGLRVLLNAWKQLRTPYPLQGCRPERSERRSQTQARELQLSGVAFRGRTPLRNHSVVLTRDSSSFPAPGTKHSA